MSQAPPEPGPVPASAPERPVTAGDGEARLQDLRASGSSPSAAGRPRRRSWAGRLARLLVTLALLALAASWLRPWAERAVKVVRLLREAPPLALPVPVEGVRASRIADTWGASRSGGRRHEGTDIFAPRGTPVRSTTRGLVVQKGWNRLGGRVVSVIGPGGQRHYYAHLEQFAGPGPGDWVEEGDLLGFVGDSGNAAGTPTHLHYGIYAASGEALNPHPLLTATVETTGRRSSRPAAR